MSVTRAFRAKQLERIGLASDRAEGVASSKRSGRIFEKSGVKHIVRN
jgi:hypothetical protein